MAQTIAVLIPGIAGTTLVRDNPLHPVWPDQVALHPNRAAALLSRSGITAAGPVLSALRPGVPAAEVPIYAGLVDWFTERGFAYVTQKEALPAGGDVLVGFGYDWRQPNRVSAAGLNAMLTRIALKYGPRARIWLIGHGMGGLVGRYLLESGAWPRTWWKVRGLITLGTPHLGMPRALDAVTGECDVTGLLNAPVLDDVIDIPTFASGFELLPPPQETFVAGTAGRRLGVFGGEVNTLLTATFGAPASGFADAAEFFARLDYGGARGGRPSYHVVYGSGHATVEGFAYDPAKYAPTDRLAPRTTLAGDGVVPECSAAFPGGWVSGSHHAAGVSHGQLPNHPGVLDQVGRWMSLDAAGDGAEEADEAAEPELAIAC